MKIENFLLLYGLLIGLLDRHCDGRSIDIVTVDRRNGVGIHSHIDCRGFFVYLSVSCVFMNE